MIANKLQYGDEIRVIAPSRSLSIVREEVYDKALAFLTDKGFKVTFSKKTAEKLMSLDHRQSNLE